MTNPLVSVIVTTRNNADTLTACLRSIMRQSYEHIELIVVDNHSTDQTLEIAKRFTSAVFTKGPERSSQRNYAVNVSNGKYILIIDSDMELSSSVVNECVANANDSTKALIIPEESFGVGFWAQCKKFERSFYNGVDWIEAPRFFDTQLYKAVGGYDESMSGGEDWDLHSRIKRRTDVGRVTSFIHHNEGHLTLSEIIRSRRYYAKGFTNYLSKPTVKANERSGAKQALGVYKLLLSKPSRLTKQPIIGVGTLFMKTIEFSVIASTKLRILPTK